MAKEYTQAEFEKFTRHYSQAKREAFRKLLLEEGRLKTEKEKSQERMAMEEEDALFQELMKDLELGSKKPTPEKPVTEERPMSKIKFTADNVTRHISPAEFEMLFGNLTDKEKSEVRTDLILSGKYDPDEEPKPEKPLSDAEIDELADL